MRATFRITAAVLMLATCAATTLAGDVIPWQPNLESAQRLAAQTNRLVLIHFWAPWCRPCMRMEQEVFSKPETAKGLEANFVMIKLNADEAPGTARLYGVSSLPSDVITTASGRLVSQLQSPPTSTQYVQQMNQAAAGHHSLARKVSDASNVPPAASLEMPAAAPAVNPYEAPPAAPRAATVAAAPTMPAANERYAEYFPENRTAPAANSAGQVMPAQAYGAVPSAPAAGYAPPLSDPYAQPPAAPPVATQPPMADPGVAPPAANPYAPANPYAAAPAVTNPYETAPVAPPAANPYAAQAPAGHAPLAAPQPANPYAAAAPPSAPANPYAAPNAYSAPPSYVAQASVAPQVQLPQLPPGCPPLALDGNCPVTLVERKRWAVGHPTFGAVHRGRTYLFLGPQEREKFLTDPDRFSPVLSGLDPVHAIDNKASAPGKREFGVFGADGKIYLFADEASRVRFEQNEQHYTTAVGQAMQQPAYQAMRQAP